MKNTGIAYLLWCTCFVGVAGVHRFYSGKYLSGMLWLFTFGFFGFGQLIDLTLIPGMVEENNLKYKLLHSSPNHYNNQSVVVNVAEQITPGISTAKPIANKSDIQLILQFAKDNNGNVSLADGVMVTGNPVVEVRKTLESLCVEGFARNRQSSRYWCNYLQNCLETSV
jgi:hypothetical protein